MAWWLILTLAQLPPGVETRTVIEQHGLLCPALSQSAFCDDPTVVMPTVDPSGDLDKVTFVGKKPGRTTCSCGLNRGFRIVWQITVVSIDEAVTSTARKVVEQAVARIKGDRLLFSP